MRCRYKQRMKLHRALRSTFITSLLTHLIHQTTWHSSVKSAMPRVELHPWSDPTLFTIIFTINILTSSKNVNSLVFNIAKLFRSRKTNHLPSVDPGNQFILSIQKKRLKLKQQKRVRLSNGSKITIVELSLRHCQLSELAQMATKSFIIQ